MTRIRQNRFLVFLLCLVSLVAISAAAYSSNLFSKSDTERIIEKRLAGAVPLSKQRWWSQIRDRYLRPSRDLINPSTVVEVPPPASPSDDSRGQTGRIDISEPVKQMPADQGK